MNLKQIKQEFLKAAKLEQQKGGLGGEIIHETHEANTNLSPITTAVANPTTGVDSQTALKNFLDSIPISLIPDINNNNFHVVELTVEFSLRDAIKMMLDKNVYGAPIASEILASSQAVAAATAVSTKKATNRYIGFLSFPTMVLWCLHEMEKQGCFDGERKNTCCATKISELAKSFLWDPFFPVYLEEDTLFRALLLFSKHRLHVLPVTDKTNTAITGFITQNALLELLLQSSGLKWFDGIAHSPLSEFRFSNEERAPHIYADQSVWEALQILWKTKASVVAVVDRKSKELMGNFRIFDMHLLLDNDELFSTMRTTTLSELIKLDSARKRNADPVVERRPGDFMSAGDLRLRDAFLETMDSPVTHKSADTLEQAMKIMVEKRTETSFLVDSGSKQMARALTSRNVIMEFAPPGIDTRLRGGGSFETALEQTGCHFERGTLVRDH